VGKRADAKAKVLAEWRERQDRIDRHESVEPPVHDFTDTFNVEQYETYVSCINNNIWVRRQQPTMYADRQTGKLMTAAEANVRRVQIGLAPFDLSKEPVPEQDCEFRGKMTVVRDHGVEYWKCPSCGYNNAQREAGMTKAGEANHNRWQAEKAVYARRQKKLTVVWLVVGAIAYLSVGATSGTAGGWVIWFFTASAVFYNLLFSEARYYQRKRSTRAFFGRVGEFVAGAVMAAIAGAVLPVIIIALLKAPAP
jgi:hypothetical protein